VMFDILVGIGLCYVAIRYGLAAPGGRRNILLRGVVGTALSILIILAGLGIMVWGILAYL
jgi:hypothetical protein